MESGTKRRWGTPRNCFQTACVQGPFNSPQRVSEQGWDVIKLCKTAKKKKLVEKQLKNVRQRTRACLSDKKES